MDRYIIAEHDGALWVASPLKKQRFRLSDGLCMEDASHSIFFSGLATHRAPSCSAIIPRDSTLALKNGSILLMAVGKHLQN
jgi:nitrite reductase/ring-hydroxylating ferredoxin subunit